MRRFIKEELRKLAEGKLTKVLYHGTNSRFEKFSYHEIGSNTHASWWGQGFYFSDSISDASQYGNIILKCKVSAENLFDFTAPMDLPSVDDDGIIHIFAQIPTLANLKLKGTEHTFQELSELIQELSNGYGSMEISTSKGTREWFTHVWYEYEGEEHAIYNLTTDAVSDDAYVKSRVISKILYEKYNISSFPKTPSEAIYSPVFTRQMEAAGYDGVIAPSSSFITGAKEYVIFNANDIEIVGEVDT